MSIIRLVIADDHEMVRKGLGLFIQGHDDLTLVGEAADIPSVLRVAAESQPDVILMDMIMPGGSGVEAIRKIRQAHPQIQIIALTSFRDESLVQQVLQAGAMGFFYKDLSVDELITAIRQVAAGKLALTSDVNQVFLRLVSKPEPSNAPLHLTGRERDVLVLMVQGMTNRQIALQLYLSPATVKQYVSSILAKLNVGSRTEAVAAALQRHLLDDE